MAIEILSTQTELHNHINYGLAAVIIVTIIQVILTIKRKTRYDVKEQTGHRSTLKGKEL